MTNLALIGIGRWGKNYIRTLKDIKDVNLKYICASSDQNLQKISGDYIKLKNYKDLIKHKEIEGIIIATPSATHYRIAKYFLPQGHNLLIEKPLAVKYEDAKYLEKIQKNSKSIAMVGHIFLYNPAFLEFKKLVNQMGKIEYLDFEGCDYGPFPKDSSALWEWAPHDVSMCLDLLSKMSISVQAWSFKKDMVYTKLNFKDTVAFMKFGWLSPVKKRKVTVVGSKSSIIFDDTKDRKISFYEKMGLAVPQYPDYSCEEPLMTELEEFVSCIRNNRPPKTDLNNSVLVLKVIDAMQKSINKNGKLIFLQ